MKSLGHCESIIVDDEQQPYGICDTGEDVRAFRLGPLTFHSTTSVGFVSKVLSVVLNAAVHTQLWAISTSNSSLRSLTIHIGLPYSKISCNGVRPGMRPCLPAPITSIRQLSIALDCNFLLAGESSGPGADFGNFIKTFPELLDFELLVVGEECLSKPMRLFHSITVPKLQKLALECVRCREHELEDFILRHKKTLTCIDFSAVFLDENSQSWDNIFQNVQDGPNHLEITMSDCKSEGGTIDDYQKSVG